MNCVSSTIKYILFLFNLLFLVCGILIIVLGSLMLVGVKGISNVESAFDVATIPILLTVLGCAIFVVSFFGCCGAIKENSCCTTTYSVFMFILFTLQVTLVVWIFINSKEFVNSMNDVMEKTWKENDQAHGYPMDIVQIGFNCCGLDSYKDYNATVVPSSCCSKTIGECPESIYVTKLGCKSQFTDFWWSNLNIIRWAGIGVALVELTAFAFSCVLISSFRKTKH